MLIVGAFPFVSEDWHIYLLVGGLNFFNAFFTPTYKAMIPQIIDNKKTYGEAISLSSATYQLLGVMGPGLAGIMAVWFGIRQIFIIDAATFLIAAVIIFLLPNTFETTENTSKIKERTWSSIKAGTSLLFSKRPIRFGLLMQLVVAIVGAQILVNTVGYVRGDLALGEQEYGWAMSALGIGATSGALLVGFLNGKIKLKYLMGLGAFIASLAILPGNYLGLVPLLIFWGIAGLGQSLVNIPTETLIASEIKKSDQGKVYGAHFAWSHLWWAFAYPLAGWLGGLFSSHYFLIAGGIALLLYGLVLILPHILYSKSKS